MRLPSPNAWITTGLILIAAVAASPAPAAILLEAEANPNPVAPSQMLETQITVSNTGNGPTGTMTLLVLWPEELQNSPSATDGGTCMTDCLAGGFLVWDLGVLGAEGDRTVSCSENVFSTTSEGTLGLGEVTRLGPPKMPALST